MNFERYRGEGKERHLEVLTGMQVGQDEMGHMWCSHQANFDFGPVPYQQEHAWRFIGELPNIAYRNDGEKPARDLFAGDEYE